MFTFLQLQRELLLPLSLSGYIISLHLTRSSSLIHSPTYISAKCKIERNAKLFMITHPCSDGVGYSFMIALDRHHFSIEHLVLEETKGTLDNDVLED
jgi:hypothetical protein